MAPTEAGGRPMETLAPASEEIDAKIAAALTMDVSYIDITLERQTAPEFSHSA